MMCLTVKIYEAKYEHPPLLLMVYISKKSQILCDSTYKVHKYLYTSLYCVTLFTLLLLALVQSVTQTH